MADEYGEDGTVRVHPPSVDFADVERGVKYVIKVAAKNVSHRQERIRFVPPPGGSGFSVQNKGTVTVAPGIEATCDIEFVLAADEDYHATLKIDVSGRVVEVPMHAYRPRAEFVLETALNFGPVVHETVASRVLKVANRGKRAGKLAFDVAMIEASGDEIAPMQRRKRSAFSIEPESCQLAPGEERELKVVLDARSLGPARGLARITVDGGVGPSLVDLAGTVLLQRVEVLDAKGAIVPPTLHFGQLFAGLQKRQVCTLVNNGPTLVSFSIATLGEDEEPRQLAEDDELDRELSDSVFALSPANGQIGPFQTAQLTLTFRPPKNAPSKAGFSAVRSELGAPPPTRFAVCKRLSVLETEQQVDLILDGHSVVPDLRLSRQTLQFAQPCRLNDHQDALVTLTNGNLEMPVDFSVDKVPNFTVTPAAGRLAAGASRELLVTFSPKQQGAVHKTLRVQAFKGAVHTLPLHVSGVCQGTNGRRRIVGGPLALPEDFAREAQLALAGSRPLDGGISALALRQPVGELANTGRQTIWQQAEALDAALASGLAGLAKKRTFGEQMALQGALDRKGMQQTGFELSARELAALSAHRERYSAFLRQAHAERTQREHSRFVSPAARDLAAFELGVDMGMASLSARGSHPLEGGWSAAEPRVPLPKARDGLWLEHPYDIDGNLPSDAAKGGRSKALLFDDRKLIKRKHKPLPTSAEEIAHCNMSLLPKDLLLVTAGPKVVNFGTISVYTTVHRSFNVSNELLTHVLVTVDAHEEAELARSSPASQVIPPSGIAGFDLLFSTAEVGPIRKTVSYSVNDRYSFKFTVVADVVPIDLELSTDELRFKFDEHDLGPSLSLPVTLSNRGTYKAEFECRGPAAMAKRPVAFAIEPEKGVVEAGKSREAIVTFTPTPGAVDEYVFTLVVEGGPSRTLLCKADLEEARCSCEPKKLEFGLVSVGIAKELSLSVKSHGAEQTVIYWDEPPAGLEIIPMVSKVPPGGTVDILFVLSAGAPLRLDAPISAHVRGGKPFKVHVSADAQLPQVGIVEDEFGFGTVTVGARALRTLTLINSGMLGAALDLRLSPFAGFDVALPPAEDGGGAPVEAGEDEDAELPLQLLSTVEDPATRRGARTAASERPASAGNGEEEGAGDANDERDYRIIVPGGSTVVLHLSFSPAEEGAFDFELPIAHVGLAVSPALRRAVSAHAVPARIVISPRHVDFGACIVRSASYPYLAELTVSNVDPLREPLAWEIDASALPEGGLLELAPTSGFLGADEAATVRISFAPEVPCAVEKLSLPVYLGGDRSKPYVMLDLSARGVRPRLAFDRSEVVLPAVPLGFTSAATFLIINDGYENLELAHKLPADSAKVPLTLTFPEGNMVGLGVPQLPVVLSFSSKKPMSFTAKVFFIDEEGRRYGINVTGSTDNSPLTVQHWLSEHRQEYRLDDVAGKAPMLVLKSAAELAASSFRRRSLNKRRQSRDLAAGSARGLLPPGAAPADKAPDAPPPPIRPEWPAGAALAKALEQAEAEAEVLEPWIRSFLLDLPSQRPFPDLLIAARGRPLVDIFEAVSGKAVNPLIPREVQSVIARPPKSKVALTRALCRQYDALITFLKQHGGLLGALKPEDLLSKDDYVRWHAAQRATAAAAAAAALKRPPGTRGSMVSPQEDGSAAADNGGRPIAAKLTEHERRALLSRHRLVSLRAWSALFYQTVKVFVLARITPRALRTTPGMAELIGKADNFELALGGSNCFSATECALLHWLTLHWRKAAPDKAVGELERIYSLDQLRDGHVLAALLLSHAPFLAPSAGAPPDASDDEGEDATAAAAAEQQPHQSEDGAVHARAPRPGSSIASLFPAPCSPEEAERNVQLCVDAMAAGLSIERPPAASTFTVGSERSILLALLGLYQTLPHYVPKTTIEFAGALHEEITKSIELTNPAKRPIQYVVRLEGSSAFELPLGRTARIEARSTLAFPVTFASRFAQDASARLLFLSRGDGVNTAHATSLSFVLDARITSKKAHASLAMEASLYRAAEQEVTVTNPFELPCTFEISLAETRPPLDTDPASTGMLAARGLSLAPRAGVQQPTSATPLGGSAAIGSSVSFDRLSELERALAKLPDAFHVASADPRKPETTLVLAPGASATIRLQFLPFMLGEHTCELSFADAKVGEFVYVVKGTATLPQPIETLSFRTEAGTSTSIQAALPYRNEALEKARAEALRRLAKVRDKDLERAREPLRKGPLYFKLEFSGNFFAGPGAVELEQPEGGLGKVWRTGSRTALTPGGAGGSRSGAATPHEADPSAPGTARGGGSPPATARAGAKVSEASASLVPLQFAPRQAGMYTSKLVLYSPLDVRVFNLAGNAPSPGTRATIEFAVPARRVVRQELPIVNATPVAWELSAKLTGQYFRGPASLTVAAGSTEAYAIEFAPEWLCESSGELVLSNETTGDTFTYALNGVGEEPLAEGTVVIDVVARSKVSHDFAVFNVAEDGKACACTVESDLMHVSGEPTVAVPPRVGPVPFGKQAWNMAAGTAGARRQSGAAGLRRLSAAGRPPPARYTLDICPQVSGSVHGSVTVRTPDGRYLWYTVEIRAAPPPPERTIEVSADVRTAAVLEVEVVNPSLEPVEFAVELEGEGLLGEPTLTIGPGPNSVAKYQVMYSPLLAGTSSGAVSFLNASVGEFWYKLLLTAAQPPPEALGLLEVELCKTASHSVRIDNPLAEALTLRPVSSNPRNWTVGVRGGSALSLPPFGSLDVVLQYSPSALGIEQHATIQLVHARLAPWEFAVRGIGLPPTIMPPTEVSAELLTLTSATVTFVNPFDQPVTVSARLDAPNSREGVFTLLMRRAGGIVVAPGGKLQASFSFEAADMLEHSATISITTAGTQALTWKFPIIAYSESKPQMKPLHLSVRARQQLQTMLELPLTGLDDAPGQTNAFNVELQGVPEVRRVVINVA